MPSVPTVLAWLGNAKLLLLSTMTNKDNENMRFNEGRRAVNHLQDQSHFDQFMEDDSTDIIVIMKDNKNQSVTMKKVQRCKVCLKIQTCLECLYVCMQ